MSSIFLSSSPRLKKFYFFSFFPYFSWITRFSFSQVSPKIYFFLPPSIQPFNTHSYRENISTFAFLLPTVCLLPLSICLEFHSDITSNQPYRFVSPSPDHHFISFFLVLLPFLPFKLSLFSLFPHRSNTFAPILPLLVVFLHTSLTVCQQSSLINPPYFFSSITIIHPNHLLCISDSFSSSTNNSHFLIF